jgi:hypothetical protein
MTGVRFPTVAVTVEAPAVAPAVNVIVATPCAFVTLDVEVTAPVPEATAHVTVRPAIGSPFWSMTVTVNGELVAFGAIVCGLPLVIVTVVTTGANGSSSSSHAAAKSNETAMPAPASNRVAPFNAADIVLPPSE